MNIIILIIDHCDKKVDLIKNMLGTDLYFVSSGFALYLGDQFQIPELFIIS